MEITMYKLVEEDWLKQARYNENKSGATVGATIRKWEEGYYLIQNGYDLMCVLHPCGLCKMYRFSRNAAKKRGVHRCINCPIKGGVCCKIQRSYSSRDRDDISAVGVILEELKEALL